MPRIYHPYTLWEEINFNMWGSIKNKESAIKEAVEFTSNHKLYGSFMLKVTKEWKFSCENALTDEFINRKAWLGHAAAALAIGVPEDITRQAWKYLTYEQQLLANKEAERAIQLWQDRQLKSCGIREYMGRQMLFQWDTRRSA